MRVDTSGNVLIGTSATRTNYSGGAFTPAFQIEKAGDIRASITRDSNDTSGPVLYLGKTRGTTVNSNTVVASGDNLGLVSFDGSDGTNMVRGAAITAQVDGTPGSADMPGRLLFSTTADGAATATERVRINSSGDFFSYRTQCVTTNSGAGYGTATFYTRLTSGTSYTLATGTNLNEDTVVTATLEYANLYAYNDSTIWAYGLRQAFLRSSTSGATTASNNAINNQTSGGSATAPTFAWTGTSTISLTVTNTASNEGWARVTVSWRNVTMSLNPVA